MINMTQPKLYTRNKILWVRFTFKGKVIKKSIKLADTKENRKIAELLIIPQFILELQEKGEFFQNNNVKQIPTVEECMKKSFKLNKGNRTKSTQLMHERNYNKHIKNVFGDLAIDKITSQDITHWQNNLKENEKLAKSSILRIRSCLNVMFEDAIENNLIQKNPIQKAKKLGETENSKVPRVKLTPFKKSEILTILNYSVGQNKNLIALLFYTGVRIAECIGLRWENIDFENKTISIRQQIVEGEIKEKLKTSKSRRTIPIIEVLMPYLRNQYERTGHKNDFVFLTKNTKKHYHDGGKVREQIWVPTLKNTNVKYRNLHQTRGTFISTLISNGEDINYVSKIAGHENVRVTLEKYSEYIPKPNENFGNCFN